MPYTQTLSMSADDQHRLLEWWNATESAKVVVRHLVSLVSELRLHPESSHADGIVLFYHFPTEDSLLKECEGRSPMSRREMNVGWR